MELEVGNRKRRMNRRSKNLEYVKIFSLDSLPLAKPLLDSHWIGNIYYLLTDLYYLIFRAWCRINAYSELIPSALDLEIEL